MKLNRKFRVRAPLQDNILSLTAIVSMIVLTLAAVALVLWLLVRTGILTYDWTLFDPQTSQTEDNPDVPSIYDVLRPEEDGGETPPDGSIVRFSGDFSTLRALLSDLDTPDSYIAVFDTALHTGSGEIRTAVRVCRQGSAYRIERYQSGYSLQSSPGEIYISDGEHIVYTDTASGERAQFAVTDGFSMEALAGIPSIASFNHIPDEQILHASYAELDGEIVYYVQFTVPDANGGSILQEYWISAGTEFVMRCRTVSGTEADAKTVFSSELRSVGTLSAREADLLLSLPVLTED